MVPGVGLTNGRDSGGQHESWSSGGYKFGNQSSFENYTSYYINVPGGEWNTSYTTEEVTYVSDGEGPPAESKNDSSNQWLLQHLVPLKAMP